MTDLRVAVEGLIARLSGAEISLREAQDQLGKITVVAGVQEPALRAELESAGRRVRLDAANMEALLGILDETRVRAGGAGSAPDKAAPTVAADARSPDEATRLVDGPAARVRGATEDE
ncbi:MAG: hypothetical protein L0H83_11905, partial [Salinisphaera sp.]|nr:hypothetical protein [Salinisphaera sp.]